MIRSERHGDVLEITLARPEKANALTADMMSTLADAFGSANDHELAVLASASPRLFSAGADIGEFVAGRHELERQETALLSMIQAMAQCRAPIVALARGRAAGAGAMLLCLADVVVAADDLQISCPEFVFGMYPVIVEAVLQSRLWPALTSRLCCGIGAIDAAQAHALGLATEVIAASRFEADVAARTSHYRDRRAGLQALRSSRRSSAATGEMLRRLREVSPLMLENYDAPGVGERIRGYVGGLRGR